MTGYGRAQGEVGGREILVEIKSVNHRYFEIASRTPRGYGFLEEKIKTYLQSRLSRGKIDVYVALEAEEDSEAEVQVNHPLALGYLNALKELAERYELRNDVTVPILSRYPDILTVRKKPEDEEAVWAAVKQKLDEALEGFVAMREREGERLKADILSRCDTILSLVEAIETRSPETVNEYRARLEAKVRELLQSTNIDDQRILTETAIFADKIAVAEETVRLRSHISQLHTMLEAKEAIGRKLDFLVQEMNREANTIGSKATDAKIAYMVVDIKAEIEKIREQIPNIE